MPKSIKSLVCNLLIVTLSVTSITGCYTNAGSHSASLGQLSGATSLQAESDNGSDYSFSAQAKVYSLETTPAYAYLKSAAPQGEFVISETNALWIDGSLNLHLLNKHNLNQAQRRDGNYLRNYLANQQNSFSTPGYTIIEQEANSKGVYLKTSSNEILYFAFSNGSLSSVAPQIEDFKYDTVRDELYLLSLDDQSLKLQLITADQQRHAFAPIMVRP